MSEGEWALAAVQDVLAAGVPDREILVCGPVRRTFAEVRDRTRSLAAFLGSRCVGLRREREELVRWECGQDAVALVLYPSEVEAALRSLDAVRQVHVTDVPDGDGRSEVGALVVTGEPRDAVAAALRPQLSAFKQPTRWLVTPDAGAVPTTATGKVDKAALRALLRPEDAAPTGAAVAETGSGEGA